MNCSLPATILLTAFAIKRRIARERICALLSGSQDALTQAAVFLTAMATSALSRRQNSTDWLLKTQTLLFEALAFTANAQATRLRRRSDGERIWTWISLIHRACPADLRPDLAAPHRPPGRII